MCQFRYDASSFRLPDLMHSQLVSFRRFLTKGIREELVRFPIIEDPQGKVELRLLAHRHTLILSKWDEKQAVYHGGTYCARLYVPVLVKRKGTDDVRCRRILLGSIPLMTTRATFVVNGVSRVLVNQIVRSPGLYYEFAKDPQGGVRYYATFIAHSGAWLRLEIDRRGRLWAWVDKDQKVPIMVLLGCMGLDSHTLAMSLSSLEIDRRGRLWAWVDKDQHIQLKVVLSGTGVDSDADATSLSFPAWLNRSVSHRVRYWQSYVLSPEDAITELYDKLRNKETDRARRKIRPDSWEEVRWQEMARRTRWLQQRFFKRRCHIGRIGRANLNKRLGLSIPGHETFLLPEDVLKSLDSLANVSLGVGSFDDIDDLRNRRVRSTGEMMQHYLRVGVGQLSKVARDHVSKMAIGPKSKPSMAHMFSAKPIATTWKELFGSHPLSQFLDQTNPLAEITHKRRISCLGPGGIDRETARFDVRDIHPSHYGRICPIETPEGPNTGLIASLASHARVNSQGVLQSPFHRVQEGQICRNKAPLYLSAGQEDSHKISAGDLDYDSCNLSDSSKLAVRYKQEFCTTEWSQVELVGIFPMQYFSVAACLIPFLEHDDANRALMGSNMQRQAVPLLNPERAIVGTGLEAQVAIDSGTLIRARQDGLVCYADARTIQVEHDSLGLVQYDLQLYQRSNQDTCIHQRPLVSQGDKVKKGQVLADGASTAGGELALGKNILVAYMPWEGYNFEDAVVISERLVYDHVYTSLHIERHECKCYKTHHLGSEMVTRNIPHLDEHLLRHLDSEGVAMRGAWVEAGDVLVGKLTPREASDHLSGAWRLLVAMRGEEIRTKQDTSLKVPPGGRGRVMDAHWLQNEETLMGDVSVTHVYVLQKRKIQVGDKVAGRHGNKGIVSKILPREDMPYLQDGTPVDMVLSPLGVPSRMNVGQIFECLLGLAGHLLGKQYRVVPFDERYEPEASRKLVFSQLCEARSSTGFRWLFEPDSPGKGRLRDGRTGEAFDQCVTVGKAYMLKLIHQVDDKIHARSTGPYSLITQQPLRGRSKQGGQRLGEMEVWALEGFGAAYTLQELLTLKSDDMQGRRDMANAIVLNRPFPRPGTPESFKVLLWELRGLLVDSQLRELQSIG
uniref:RNA polymerase beta subunit n=1 Tax=Hormidiella parvula TaxID=2058785 RepID=UPI00286A7BE7|nr:RNA polymerase beta subunit [Hormidiella parvula]WKT05946.1 RNA polymerase beta subunit [Hormidiella parvula]